jgi:starch synthase
VNVLEWDHCINSLAVAQMCLGSDNGFSNYLNEINYSANGLESLLILYVINQEGYGIDTEVWDPKDKMLEKKLFS